MINAIAEVLPTFLLAIVVIVSGAMLWVVFGGHFLRMIGIRSSPGKEAVPQAKIQEDKQQMCSNETPMSGQAIESILVPAVRRVWQCACGQVHDWSNFERWGPGNKSYAEWEKNTKNRRNSGFSKCERCGRDVCPQCGVHYDLNLTRWAKRVGTSSPVPLKLPFEIDSYDPAIGSVEILYCPCCDETNRQGLSSMGFHLER